MKECPECGFHMDDRAIECRHCHGVSGQQAPAPGLPMAIRDPWVMLGIGVATCCIGLGMYFILLATNGAFTGPNLSKATGFPPSPGGSSALSTPGSLSFSTHSPLDMPPAVTMPSSSLTREAAMVFSSDKSFQLVGDAATRSGNGWMLSGKIRNTKKKTITSLNLILSYEDSNGTQLGRVNVHVEHIPPGGKAPFTVSIPDPRASAYRESGYSCNTR